MPPARNVLQVGMEVKAETVASLPPSSSPGGAAHVTGPESPADYAQRSALLARTVVRGLARLVEGQRRLAEEFGLSLGRVFPNSHEWLEGQNPEEALTALFRSGHVRAGELEDLFEDLCAHQLALVSALDDIALATMRHLSPEQLKEDYPERRMNDAKAWRFYKERLRELVENDNLRFQRLVGAGFVQGYTRARG